VIGLGSTGARSADEWLRDGSDGEWRRSASVHHGFIQAFGDRISESGFTLEACGSARGVASSTTHESPAQPEG